MFCGVSLSLGWSAKGHDEFRICPVFQGENCSLFKWLHHMGTVILWIEKWLCSLLTFPLVRGIKGKVWACARIFHGPSPQKGGNRGCEECEEQLHGCSQNIPGQGNESPSESAPPPCFHSWYCSTSLLLCLSPFPLEAHVWSWDGPGRSGWGLLSWCWAPKVPHPWLPHDLLSPSWLPMQHRG